MTQPPAASRVTPRPSRPPAQSATRLPISAVVTATLSSVLVVGWIVWWAVFDALYADDESAWAGFGAALRVLPAFAIVALLAIIAGLIGLATSLGLKSGAGVWMSLTPVVALAWAILGPWNSLGDLILTGVLLCAFIWLPAVGAVSRSRS